MGKKKAPVEVVILINYFNRMIMNHIILESEESNKMSNSEETKNMRSKKSVRFFAISLVILIVSSIFIWGFQTSWGQVRIERITIMGSNGTEISTLIYIPDNATAENPAPGVVIYHGRSNQAHSNDTWCMELARRGMVVLSPDLSGGGESDVTNRVPQAIDITAYALNSLDIIQKDNLNIIGYSAGSHNVLMNTEIFGEKLRSSLGVFGPFMVQLTESVDKLATFKTNYGLIKSTADQYDYFFIGDPEANNKLISDAINGGVTMESGKDYVFNELGNEARYIEIDGTLHQTGNISTETINAILDFERKFATFPNDLDNSNQLWKWQQLFSGIAAVDMMFLLAATIGLMLESTFFSSLTSKRASKPAQKGAKAWSIDLLFSFVIPAILFVPVSAYAMALLKPTKFLRSPSLNGIMAWLLVVAIIGGIRLLIKKRKSKKAGEIRDLSYYALGSEGETKLKLSNFAKAVLLGVGILCFFGLIMTLLETYFGISIQVWNLSTYLKPNGDRVIAAIPYMIIIFIVMLVGNISPRILPSTGSEKKDMIIAVTVNCVLTASALFILLLIQYGGSMIIGTGQTLIPQIDVYGTGKDTSVGALDFAFGYCYMMGGTTAVVTYIYRKYGNILAAVITCAMFAGLFTTLSFAFNI